MAHKNNRVELEMKIMKYRLLAWQAPDDVTRERIENLVVELEQKLREIDARIRPHQLPASSPSVRSAAIRDRERPNRPAAPKILTSLAS